MEPVSPDRKDPYLRLACVNIFVKDQDRSLRFYVDQLGFNLVIDESYESGTRWVAVAPPDGQAVLALITPRRNSEEHKFIGRCRNAVLVTEDVMSKFEEWGKRGVRFHHPPQTTLWGGIFTRFDDLDGNSFSLVSRDDFVREIEAKRRAAAEKLEAERRAAQELEIASRFRRAFFRRIRLSSRDWTMRACAYRRARLVAIITISLTSGATASASLSATFRAKASGPRYSWPTCRQICEAKAPLPLNSQRDSFAR